jgi:hypothetical protein
LLMGSMMGAESENSAGELRKIPGAPTCSSTSCHGGAEEKTRQTLIWTQRDPHSRAFVTLTNARAARMAEALGIKDATTSSRCTSCHAPLQTIDAGRLAADARMADGVSCVSCHGVPDTWLRSHTRTDFSHADRVAAGMRDLRDLRARANACVACHQNIPADLVAVGRHPALIFELDGQTQSQPPHWREPAGRSGAQAWLVGQAVAWRETSAALRDEKERLSVMPRWQALSWLLRRAGFGELTAPLTAPADGESIARAVDVADRLARQAAAQWTTQQTTDTLAALAGAAADFRTATVPAIELAHRAERLVLALDRLIGALPAERRPAGVQARLDGLFRLAQSQRDFMPASFARELEALAEALPAGGR